MDEIVEAAEIASVEEKVSDDELLERCSENEVFL
jgi:hypothetical protein